MYGRQIFDIKICASPGRDRCAEEEKLIKKKSNSFNNKILPDLPLNNQKEQKNKILSIKSISSTNSNDNEIFTLQVKNL